MPRGKGTYGSKVGRPPKKKTKKLKRKNNLLGLINKFLEWSLQRQENKLFQKHLNANKKTKRKKRRKTNG